MTEVEKSRKCTRKNRKKEIKTKFRHLMRLAKSEIKNATDNYCYVRRHYFRDEYFALWIVAKKLEAKGFKCELEKGRNPFSNIYCYDELTIYWE